MPSTDKRNTRSSTTMNLKMSSNTSIATSLTQENFDEEVPVKRARTQRQIINKKQPVNKPDHNILPDEFTNNHGDESIFATLEPVPLNLFGNIDVPPSSPPPLVIDTANDIICSQYNISNASVQNQSNDNYNPARTPLGHNRTNSSSKNNTSSFSKMDVSNNINQKDISTNNITTSTIDDIRTPTIERNTSSTFSQISNRSIIDSANRCQRNSNKENIYNHRTSTPCPARHEQINNATQANYDDSFNIDSIPPETKNVLFRFPEFRRLVKEYKNEQRKCKIWINDYARLKRNYERLEQNSFPRPPAPALNYLVDLVTHIQQSNGCADPRSNEQIATDLGVSRVILMSLKDITPQQSALNLFNHLYPGYITKMNLNSITNLEILKPGLLETILVFAQRATPGVGYHMQDLRDTLSNSIRGARYHFRRKNVNNTNVAAILDMNDVHGDASQREDYQNTSRDNPNNVINNNRNENYEESRFDGNESM